MSPRAHVAHHRHPAQALEEKFAQGAKIGDRLHGIGQELHFKTLFCNQTANKEIIRGPVLNGGVAAESGEMFSRSHNCLAERELDSVQLPGHQNTGIKIANHAYGLEFLDERVFVRGYVKSGDSASLRIAK